MDDNERIPDVQKEELGEVLRRLGDRINDIDVAQRNHGGELREVKGEVHGLHRDLDGLTGKVSQFNGDLDELRTAVSRVEKQVATQNTLLKDMREDLRRKAAKDDARAELERLLREKERRFGRREQTRELARGLVSTLTAESVQRKTLDTALIRRCVEERLLYEPGFWLAPALLHVAATYGDRPELSQEARGHAIALDTARTYLFIALTAARLENYRLAGSATDNYLQTLDPLRLTQDFLVVLEATANRELGPQAESFARNTMERWFAEAPGVRNAAARARERLEHWHEMMWPRRERLPEGEFTALHRVYAGDWDVLTTAFEQATVAHGTLAYLMAEFPEQPDSRSDVRHMDSALEHLINRLDPDEAELQAKIDWQELLLSLDCDEETAQRELALRQSVDAEVMTFEQLLDNAVFKPSQVELGTEARKLALMCVWPQIQAVATACVETSLKRRPEQLPIVIDGWQGALPVDPAAPVEEKPLQAALAQHVAEVTRHRVEQVQPRPPRVLGGALGALATLVVAVLWQQAVLILMLVCLLCAGAIGFEFRRVPAEQRRLQAMGQARQREVAQLLSAAVEQRGKLLVRWDWYASRLTALTGWMPQRTRRQQ
ncbi:hypothetical protein [Streptomyces mirabilis]|uniref:hypothetical protein n=1 Tax=Streptomyces mirabilis TaxID=68239 RepID=UPI0035DE4125